MTSKYRIVAKRDFPRAYGTHGFLINGKWVTQGFVVVLDHCRIVNVMPGATWFRTIADAFHGIDCLERSGGSAAEFWRLIRERDAA
jgi:hypothetical protein